MWLLAFLFETSDSSQEEILSPETMVGKRCSSQQFLILQSALSTLRVSLHRPDLLSLTHQQGAIFGGNPDGCNVALCGWLQCCTSLVVTTGTKNPPQRKRVKSFSAATTQDASENGAQANTSKHEQCSSAWGCCLGCHGHMEPHCLQAICCK